MFALRKAAWFQNGLFFYFWVFKTLQLFCMFSSWSLYLMKSMQGGQPVPVKACSTVTPALPALNLSITFLTWTTRSQSKGRLKSTRPFWKPVCEHLIYFCSTPRLYITKKIKFLIRADHNHQIKCDIPSTTSENEACCRFLLKNVMMWKGLQYAELITSDLTCFFLGFLDWTENYKGITIGRGHFV